MAELTPPQPGITDSPPLQPSSVVRRGAEPHPAPPGVVSPPAPGTHGVGRSGTRLHSAVTGRLAGLWRPPFERTWSVPEQYGTTLSSPGSKCSSRSSIEQVIKEEAISSSPRQGRRPPATVANVGDSFDSVKSGGGGGGGTGAAAISIPVYGGVQCSVCLEDKSGLDEEDNNSIMWSQSPRDSTGFNLERPISRSDSVEKRARRVLAVGLGAAVNGGGSVRPGLRNFSNGVPVARAAAGDCNTLPNSPTATTKRSFVPLFGRVRRFPSLKFQRHMHSMAHGGSSGQPLAHPIARKTIVRSTPTLQDGRGPTITITTHSDEELRRGHHPFFHRSGAFNSTAYLGDETSLYGTPKEQLSPPKEGGLEHQKSVATSTSNFLRDQIISFFQPSDNKLAMKLFGNKNALMREKMRQKAAGNWVIHPCSNFR